MKFVKTFGTVLAIFLIAGGTAAFGKIVQKKTTVQILTPKNGQQTSSQSLTIAGSTQSKAGVTNVSYQLNGGLWTKAFTANQWRNWLAIVTNQPGTNVLRAFATDAKGTVSATSQVKYIYAPVVVSLKNLVALMTPDIGDPFTISFGASTFSAIGADTTSIDFDNNGVGTYANSKVSSFKSKLTLTYKSPSTMTNNKPFFFLQFSNNTSGSYSNSDGSTGVFELSTAENLAVSSLEGTSVTLSDDSGHTNVLIFPPSSVIFDSGHLFNVSNPMAIPLTEQYPGNPGDRVTVDLGHYGFSLNRWTFLNSIKDSGTVLSTGINSGGTNTVNVLFDVAPFVSSRDAFIPLAGGAVHVLTFYFTNVVDDTVGEGLFNYKTYSPDGAMLQLNFFDNSIDFDQLQFTDTDSGILFATELDSSGNLFSQFYGNFTFAPFTGEGGGGGNTNLAPASVVGKTLVTTNSTGFFESVFFVNGTAFTETNSYNMTNSTGTYFYTNSANESLVQLDFTSGAAGFTNLIGLVFAITNSGTFTNAIFDSSSYTNFAGKFILQ